jgi:RNA polymerase sigma-70 factor (ECF subfamily)
VKLVTRTLYAAGKALSYKGGKLVALCFGSVDASQAPPTLRRGARLNPFLATIVRRSTMEMVAYESRSSVNDTQLITRVVAGDAAAERELYETYVDRIYRLAFRLAGEDELARDFTQATFIRAFEKIGSFRGESSLSTWLHSIGVSVALNGLRKTKRLRNREAPMEEGLMVGASRTEAEPDLKERMARAIDALADKYRTVFVMHDVEGYTHDEISGTLNIPIGTSKSHLFQARSKLRVALADFAPEWAS